MPFKNVSLAYGSGSLQNGTVDWNFCTFEWCVCTCVRSSRKTSFHVCVCVHACDTYVVRSRCGCGVDGVDGVGGVAGVDGIGGVDGVAKWVFCG